MPGGEHLDSVAGADRVRQRHDAPVDLRAPAPMTDLRVDLVGKVEWSRAGRQVHDVAARREGIHALRLELRTERHQDRPVFVGLFAGLEELPQPRDTDIDLGLRAAGTLLVAPVRGDTQLGLVVHLVRTNLDLQRPAAGTDDCGVQRSVARSAWGW